MQKTFMRGEKKIIEGFKNGIFPLNSDDEFEEQQTSKKFNKNKSPEKPTKTDSSEIFELITKKETGIDRDLFKNYFKFQMLTAMLKTLLYSLNVKEKNNLLVNMIKNSLSDLKNEIRKMSEDEIKIEKPYQIVNIVEEILKFNEKNNNKKELA